MLSRLAIRDSKPEATTRLKQSSLAPFERPCVSLRRDIGSEQETLLAEQHLCPDADQHHGKDAPQPQFGYILSPEAAKEPADCKTCGQQQSDPQIGVAFAIVGPEGEDA